MTSDYITVIAGFLIVVGIMGITLFLMKKFLGKINHSFSAGNRINILEVRYIDPKNKLVLISRDKKQHLLLIGQTNAILVENNIEPTDNKDSELLQEAVEKIKNDANS